MELRYVDRGPWWGENKRTNEIGVQLRVEGDGRSKWRKTRAKMVGIDERKNFIILALNRDRAIGRAASLKNLSSPSIQPGRLLEWRRRCSLNFREGLI